MTVSQAGAPYFDRGVMTNVHQGDCLVSSEEEVTFSTVLGSCISACVRDVEARVGGMNHFLLAEPQGAARDRFGASARYGAFAMEQLINMVLSRGTRRKSNLEIKIFGGGLINAALMDVGAKNIEFVRGFLSDEGYSVASEDVGGAFARRVMFKPRSGRALVKRLDSAMGDSVAKQEMTLVTTRAAAPPKPPVDDIELF